MKLHDEVRGSRAARVAWTRSLFEFWPRALRASAPDALPASSSRRGFAHAWRSRIAPCCACALLLLGGASSAQEPAGPSAEKDDVERKIIELFGKVERRLREIDRLLYDAGAGDRASLERVGASGMDELLELTQQSGRTVIEDIDQILELAEQLPGQSSSSSSSGDKPQGSEGSGQSALDQQAGSTTERESTPSSPKPGGEKDGQQPGSKPSSARPQDGEGQPQDPRASEDRDPKTAPGKAQPPGATGAAAGSVDGKDRWGDLPIHARDVFRIEGGGDMPVKYRDWIDSYYKKLNAKP